MTSPVPDLAAQQAFYTGLWGLSEAAVAGSLSYLAAEGSGEQYIVRLRQSPDKRIDLIAFGAATPADVDVLAAGLGSGGVRLISEPGILQTPGVGYGFRFFDNEGRTVEVSADVAVREHRKIAAREAIPVRLSHVAINSPTPEATVDFYVRHLGFAVSDQLIHPAMGEMMWFLRCDAWHHSLAIARCPHSALHHVSFEMRWSSPPNLSGSTRTPGTRTSTTSAGPTSPTSGGPRTR